MGSERSQTVFSSNVKLDRFLQREKMLLEKSAASAKQEISCQQRVAFGKFKKKYFLSEISHAQLYNDKEEKKELERVMLLERTLSTDTLAYKRMLSNRITTAPPGLRARMTPFSYRSGDSKPVTPYTKKTVKTTDPLKDLEQVEHSNHVSKHVYNPEIDKIRPEAPTEEAKSSQDQMPEKGVRVFITETEVPNRPATSANAQKPGRPVDSINRSKSFGALSEKRMQLQRRRSTFKEFEDADRRGKENLKEGIEVLRYPHSGDVFTRVGLRLNKYLCRPQEISKKDSKTGDAEFRESELLKQHRLKVKSANYADRIAQLATIVETDLKSESMDVMGERTLKRLHARKVMQMQPTPDELVQKYCGNLDRIPRSHTFQNWTLDD